MKILIFALGSRGDVQPYLGLAVGLQQAGHDVTLATSASSSELIQAHGVGIHPVRFSVQAFLQQPETQAIMKSGNTVRQFRMMREVMDGSVAAMANFGKRRRPRTLWCRPAPATAGVEAASQRGLPMAMAYALPFPPTRAFASFFLPIRPIVGRRLQLSHAQADASACCGAAWAGRRREWRATLGRRAALVRRYVCSVRAAGTPWLFGYSPSVLPKPADWGDYRSSHGLLVPGPGRPAGGPTDFVHFLESGRRRCTWASAAWARDHAERRRAWCCARWN